jgi:hypothetical protein
VPKTGLPIARARALGPGGRSDGPAVAYGIASRRRAGNAALLPTPFLDSLGQSAGGIPKRDEVVLSDQELPAWRYRDLRPLGSTRALTVYVVPTDAGVATVACLAPHGARAPSAVTCDAIAATLRLRRAKPYPTGPSDAYAAALTGTLGELRRDADRRGPALAVARTTGDRSREARALAADYERAARRFAALTLSPADEQVNRRLVSALRRVGRAYGAVARAAAGSAAVFDDSRAAAARAEQAIDGALAALRAAGYSATAGGGAAGASAPAKDAPAGTAPASDAPTGSAPATTRPAPAPAPAQPCDPDSEGASDDPSDDAGGCDEP